MNQAADHVRSTKEQSPVREYVADHGRPINREEIDHTTIAGRSVAVAGDLTADERELVAEAIRATKPVTRACFANSLKLWNHNSRFMYAEGFAALDEFDVGGFEHAWVMLDGEKLVDVTTTFDDYYGAVITDEVALQRHYDVGEERGVYGVVGDHRNRFEFLRERGYVEG